MNPQHRTVTYVCIGGPMDGQLLAAPIDRDRYVVQLPTEPISLADAMREPIDAAAMVFNTVTYRLSGTRDPTALRQWACPEDMTDDQALARLLADPNALRGALRAYCASSKARRK